LAKCTLFKSKTIISLKLNVEQSNKISPLEMILQYFQFFIHHSASLFSPYVILLAINQNITYILITSYINVIMHLPNITNST